MRLVRVGYLDDSNGDLYCNLSDLSLVHDKQLSDNEFYRAHFDRMVVAEVYDGERIVGYLAFCGQYPLIRRGLTMR